MSLGEVHNMMFYRHPENINLMHSLKFNLVIFLKYSFSVPPVYPMSHNSHRDVPRTSLLRPKVMST